LSTVGEPAYQEVGLEALHLLTVPQVAGLLGVSARTVWRLVYAEEKEPGTGLASVKIGRARRVAPEDLAAYIADLRRHKA
jgi:excisionase family DNA binding protein